MPQASSEQVEEWGFDDAPVIEYLESRGYRHTRQWCWKRPKSGYVPTQKEISAICYLIDEYDWGGLVD